MEHVHTFPTDVTPDVPFMAHPLMNIQWLSVNDIQANDYNPNVVLTAEMKLLEVSLLTQLWIQPVLVNRDPETGLLEIIDGFHRWTLTRTIPSLFAMTGGYVPCCVMELAREERMMLTIRINRAKGNHQAIQMHKIVDELFHQLGVSKEAIAKGIGASKEEVELLLRENVFAEREVARTAYSKSWVPSGTQGMNR